MSAFGHVADGVDIACGDCVDLMAELPDECVDMAITSPPYDNLRDYEGYSFDWHKTISGLYRVIKDGGVLVWIVNDATIDGSETGTSFKQALFAKDCGFKLYDTMIWDKGSSQYPGMVRYCGVFEYMFVFSKGKPKTINLIQDKPNSHAGLIHSSTERRPDGRLKTKSGTVHRRVCNDFGVRSNVWRMNAECNNKTSHPAVFPIALVRDHIRTWSKPGDVILDPLMGSGTTGVACILTDRKFIGIEISEKYYQETKQRLINTAAQGKLFPYED